jgi:hypothetical protein
MEPGSGSECLSSAQKNFSRQHVLLRILIDRNVERFRTLMVFFSEIEEIGAKHSGGLLVGN